MRKTLKLLTGGFTKTIVRKGSLKVNPNNLDCPLVAGFGKI